MATYRTHAAPYGGVQRKDLALVCPSVHITLQLTIGSCVVTAGAQHRISGPVGWYDVRTAVVRNRDGTVRPGEPNPRACSTRLLVF